MKYKAYIFDMDGTILDTLEDLADTLNVILVRYQYETRTLEEVRSFVGNGIRLLIKRGVGEAIPEEKLDQMLEEFKSYYRDHCMNKTKVYEGIEDVLHRLRQEGCYLAVVSNKADFAVKQLCQQYFPDIFQGAAGERETEGIRKKPAPDMVENVLRQFQVSQKEAVYIGDSEVDIETAKAAGLDSLIVGWGFRKKEFLLQQGASEVLESPKEIYLKTQES